MRKINVKKISDAIASLCIKSNIFLPYSIKEKIMYCKKKESGCAADILDFLIENYQYAEEKNIPVCQDTGMVIVFLEIGQDVVLEGGSLIDAVNDGVKYGYVSGHLRCSIVDEPLYERLNTCNNTPAIIYTNIVDGDKINIKITPKGFGSENMSRLKMMLPTSTEDDIVDFVIETVSLAGANACPPMILGIGIGGDFEYCAYLAKKALCRDLSIRNINPLYSKLEMRILNEINSLCIGPQGLGGKTTTLGVNIEYYATHIASMPVAVNIGCHATRHMSIEI